MIVRYFINSVRNYNFSDPYTLECIQNYYFFEYNKHIVYSYYYVAYSKSCYLNNIYPLGPPHLDLSVFF